MNAIENKCLKNLGVSRQYVIDMICDAEAKGGAISNDCIRPIAEKCANHVIEDLIDTADHENWNDSDVRLAFGRALIHFLHITT